MDVRVLGCRVVAPDAQAVDVRYVATALIRKLGDRAIVVQPGHGGELARIEIRRIALGNQRIRVRRIADDQNLHAARSVIVERLALHGKDGGVRLDQVLALHTLAARARTDEQCVVHVLEGNVGVVRGNQALNKRERAVLELHDNAAQRVHRRRDLQQLQDHGLVFPEHLTGCDAKQQGVSDLAGGSGDGDAHGFLHGGFLIKQVQGSRCVPVRAGSAGGGV